MRQTKYLHHIYLSYMSCIYAGSTVDFTLVCAWPQKNNGCGVYTCYFSADFGSWCREETNTQPLADENCRLDTSRQCFFYIFSSTSKVYPILSYTSSSFSAISWNAEWQGSWILTPLAHVTTPVNISGWCILSLWIRYSWGVVNHYFMGMVITISRCYSKRITIIVFLYVCFPSSR